MLLLAEMVVVVILAPLVYYSIDALSNVHYFVF